MELDGARALVVGGTGVLGSGIARALKDKSATVVVTGRDEEKLNTIAEELGTDPITLDVLDTDGCSSAVEQAVEALGGLDLLVVATGVPAFGPAVKTEDVIVEELFAVNTLGPIAVIRAAAGHLSEGGRVAVLSAIIADQPTNGMAGYSAAKAALSAWLQVARRENRRAFGILDVRPPHLDTGLADHPLAGEPPKLPQGLPGQHVVDKIIEGLESDKDSIVWDGQAKELAFG